MYIAIARLNTRSPPQPVLAAENAWMNEKKLHEWIHLSVCDWYIRMLSCSLLVTVWGLLRFPRHHVGPACITLILFFSVHL